MAEQRKQRFAKVETGYNFPQMEDRILEFWEQNEIFAKSLTKPAPKGNWVFYEGPPTANALPHPGHVLTRTIKDCLPRFKTMQGYYVRRQAGWDTHGLPVELSVEKELIKKGEMTESGPEAIRAYGLEKFNAHCFDSVRRYEQEWVKLSNRIAFWLDYENAYFTFTNQYVESVWWLLKQAYDRGLMYKGHRIQWYSTLVGCGLSSHEVAQNWQTVKDPSVWVRAHVPKGTKIGTHEANLHTYFLLWTTTPWTLLSNVALCVHPDYEYVVVEFHNQKEDRREYLVLAEGLLKANGLEGENIVARVKGRELAGLPYDRLFDYDVPDIRRDGAEVSGWHVIADEYVTLEDGTGIVHIAPAFGEDDYRVGLRENLPFLLAMDRDGRAIDTVKISAGKWFKDVDPDVITDLKHRGLLFKTQKVEHNYPHCYRTDAPLMSYPLDSWFIKVTEIQDRLIANNKEIRWQPEHIRDGRFGDWLNNVIDWSLSRDRFWGTPLPVWVCAAEGCGHQECLGSYAELKEKCPEKFAGVTDLYDREQFNPHRPYIDEFTWACPQCGGRMVRERYIIDPWFDAGSMPFSQLHYPFENKELVDDAVKDAKQTGQFPADFISEAVDQTRGWFYTLHVIATLIKDSPAYKSCLVLGHIMDDKGRKMSKSKGNDIDPWHVINNHGADAFRWYFYSGGNLFAGARFTEAGVVEGLQRFIIPLWNIYSFFTIYANIDDFDPAGAKLPWERLTELDRVALIKLNKLVRDVTAHLENLELTEAAKRFETALEVFSNWYVRRSRRRFWQEEQDDAKQAAYQTLYTILATVSRMLAPFMPFIAEELYQKLVRPFSAAAPESVHLAEYPVFDPALTDDELEYSTDQARRVVSLGHAARKESGLRVRQPLSKVTLISTEDGVRTAVDKYISVILDELNVKSVEWAEDETEFVSYEYKPNFRQLGPRFGKESKQVADWIAGHANEITLQLDERRRTGENGWIEFELTGEVVHIDEDCFEVHLMEKPETVAQRDGQLLLVLDTHVSAELKLEGLAREVVNRLQNKRKQLDLDYTDRITVAYTAPDELQVAIDAHRDYITGETLANELSRVENLDGHKEETKIDEMELCFTVKRV
ncbi:isoleucine--tRNA ligase [bacterium]|nr:isoleucine--tRNA ligase [bacterium]